MQEVIRNLTELLINVEHILECTEQNGAKEAINLKDKILFLLRINEKLSPSQITQRIGIIKSNLAALMQGLVNQGLVSVTKDELDGRSIVYTITKKGINTINERFNLIGKTLKLNPKKEKSLLKNAYLLNNLLKDAK